MGRTYFPTGNTIGVRTLSGAHLDGDLAGADYSNFHAPAEPAPRSVSIPVNLGAVMDFSAARDPRGNVIFSPYDSWARTGPRSPAPLPVSIPPVTSPPRHLGPPVQAPPAPPPVSAQTTPTPQVTVPPAPAPGAVLVSSGGGTPSPSTAPPAAVPARTGFVDSIATWMGGTTPIFSYQVPNAILAAVVVLGFAYLESGGGATTGRRR